MPQNSFFSLPKRKIRVDIVTLFLLLVTLSTLTIIAFSTYRNKKSILSLSDMMVEEVGAGLLEKISGVIRQSELIPAMTKSLVTKNEDLCIENRHLINYLTNIINLDPYISSINIAAIDGDLLAVYNVPMAKLSHYSGNPTEPLPESIKYAVRTIERTGSNAGENWEYRGTDGALIGSEKLDSSTFDPRVEKWYSETANWPHLHWSKVGVNQWGETIITVSVPLWDVDRKLLGVMGVNVSLNQLSNYISHMAVGLTGKVFIISDGEIIIPPSTKLDVQRGISHEAIAYAYEQYKLTKKKKIYFEKGEGSYFAFFAPLPLTPETKWLVMMIIPFDDFFGEFVKTQRQTLLISFLLLLVFAVIVFLSSKYISHPIVALSKQVDRIKRFDFEEREPLKSRIEEITTLQSSISAMRGALKAFSLYVPQGIVKTLIERGEQIKLGGERKELTVMFTDIENFTSLSESLAIDQMTNSLGAYFDVISKVILEQAGTIDKYIGDSVMAFWGAPEHLPDHAEKACLAGLYVQKRYREELSSNPQLPPWKTRIGIHTGEVVVGNIGTTERMNYTSIGSAVNLASRLQSMNKEYKTEIIISESVLEKIGVRYVTRPLDFVTVKGKQNKITIHELAGSREIDELKPTPDRIELCESFSAAYALFHQGKIRESRDAFLAIQSKFPNDIPTKLYLDRIEKI